MSGNCCTFAPKLRNLYYISLKTFEELGVSEEIRRAITELGFESPMPVQEEVIPYLLGSNNDVIALAQTGTGKTAAFGIPVLQRLDPSSRDTQALILSPTRELCLQIADDLKDFSKFMNGINIVAVYGGTSIENQIRALRHGAQVIVATPGRLIDLMNRGKANLEKVYNVVLDEADEMLNMGFTDSINEILAAVPETRNMLLFSATMPKEIAAITKKYMRDPKEIVIGVKNEGNKNIRDIYYMVRAQDKYLALKRIADYYPNIYGIIFCRTRKETQEIADKLIQDGYNADSLHGELSQAQRDYVMQKFRIKNLQLLVATDVAARGLDVDDLTHVINYGLPDEIESYTHRRGRTGRAGKTGISISICHIREKSKIKQIERVINKQFEKGVMPTGEQICEKQLFNLVDQIEKVKVNEEEIAGLMPSIYRKLEWLDKEDIIKRMVSLEFNRMIDYYKDADDIEVVDEKRPKRVKGEAEAGYTRLFLNFGKTDTLSVPDLIELVNRCVPGHVQIGRIDLHDNFSFFEVVEEEAQRVIDQMNGFEVDGRRIHVEVSQARVEPGEKRKGRKERKGGRAAGFGGFKAKREGGKRKEKRRDEAPKSRKESRKAEKKEGKKKKFYEDAPGYKKRK